MVSKGIAHASPQDVIFRDPRSFVAGELHRHQSYWKLILSEHPKKDEILSYIVRGVNISDFFVPFKGDFQGKFYSSATPPAAFFPNSKSCLDFEEFISSTILDRVKNGSLLVWGKVGSVQPPHLVLPITVEPTKPRMCHDERFLNLWIKDLPLSLDYISGLPRYVFKSHFQTTFDDKSGYDHIRLSPVSFTFVGLEWKGWYFCYKTLPFGWKASAYIYHTVGLAATCHIRSLGVPCSQYIDDRHVGQLALRQDLQHSLKWSNFQLAEAAAFIVCSVLVLLGYFIGLSKSIPVPQTRIRFLGFLSDSILQAFLIPQDKKIKFASLRDSILQSRTVSVKTLQRFAGKITSFSLAVPAAQLYAREVYRAISLANRSSRPIKVVGDLRSEIAQWRFLDSWSGHLPWMDERHLVVKITSDASQYAWGGIIYNPSGPPLETRDIWKEDVRVKPIAVKEALALVNTLKAGKSVVSHCRVDAHVDSLTLIQAWGKQGGKSKQLNDALKELYQTLLAQNISLCLQFVPSPLNQADALSRVLSEKDCMLAPEPWKKLEYLFGPHTIDLMALDSNAQVGCSGLPLPHFTPFPTPDSRGVNVFAQDVASQENAYVFPPFILVGPLLRFFDNALFPFTIVVPKLSPLPFWWPLIQARASHSVILGRKADRDIVLFPSPLNVFSTRPLPWDLYAFRITNSLPSVPSLDSTSQNLEAGSSLP